MAGFGKQETVIGAAGKVAVTAHDASDERGSSKKKWLLPLILLLLCLALAAGLIVALNTPRASGDTGTYVIPQGSMTSAEAQALLDEQTESSRITVSLAPTMRLTSDGSLRANFIVEEPNNGLSERLEIEQDGRVVYASGTVRPGYAIEWCQAPEAHAGPALATVYALDDAGADRGNPVSVEVQIVAG